MSEQSAGADSGDEAESLDADEYGSLTIEDEPGTVNPADLAGTASEQDAGVGYEPEFSDADGPE